MGRRMKTKRIKRTKKVPAPEERTAQDQARNVQRLLEDVLQQETRTVTEIMSEGFTRDKLCEVATKGIGWAEEICKAVYGGTIPPTDCKKGCAWCCSMDVKVTIPEIIYIEDFIRKTFAGEKLSWLEERLRTTVKKISGFGTEQRAESDVFCGFLDENKECMIYPARPLVCRGWQATRVSDCEKAFGTITGKIEVYPQSLYIYETVEQGIVDGLQDLGLPDESRELNEGVYRALMNPGTAERLLEQRKYEHIIPPEPPKKVEKAQPCANSKSAKPGGMK